jgi:hypothetical protein
MINEEIINYFSVNCDSRGIPNVKSKDWQSLITTFDKDEIRQSLAEYIHRNKIPFPTNDCELYEVNSRFTDFYFRSHLDQYKDFDVVEERYEYKYKYADMPLGVIDKSNHYNVISDYFQQMNRMKCGSNSSSAPLEIWNDKDKLSRMNWTFWREGIMADGDLNEATFRTAFRLGTYTATQFRPSVAKALYEKHKAENVLDTSCGWGDRLAGFYGTPCTKMYVGCDPNPDVFEIYKKQCVAYERLLGGEPTLIEKTDYFECVGKKTVKIWNLPSEDVNWDLYIDTFDFYFTSPPYFETEKYATDTDKASNQSWARYDSFNGWKYNFFFKVTETVWKTIKQNGYMMINIIEPRTKGSKRLPLCDDMVEHFASFKDSFYVGKIGMRMMARPNAVELKDVFIEPVWVFRKGNSEYPKTEKSTLDSFFA